MNKKYFKRALLLFQAYKSYQLTDKDLNKAASNSSKLKNRIGDFNLLLSMAKDTVSGKYKMSTWNMSVIVGTIIYVASPVDAIPDIVPVLGWLDDITIVGYAVSKLSEEMKKYKAFSSYKMNQPSV